MTTGFLFIERPTPLFAVVPPVTFWVAPADDWVQSGNPWTPGATISLTIEDGSGVVYADSQTADASGNFNFDLWDTFDLQRGHLVTVSDGTNTKTHTVTNLFVDAADAAADFVLGRADPGTSVDVWVHGNGGVTVTADGAGDWVADFSGMTDLTYLSDGGSSQTDSDGDWTGVWWAAPRFWVAPVDDWVQSSSPWTPGATISLTIEDGSGVVYADSQTADASGHFFFSLWNTFDLQRGHLVTVSDGTNTKTHTVTNLFVDAVDAAADFVLGRADAGTSVDVWVHGNGGVTVTADGAGDWVADFSGMTDLTYLSDGGSSQTDSDGDATGVWWAAPAVIPVEIDIKPGTHPNCFNPDGHGVIPVAILGSMDLDVTQIDVSTLGFSGLDVRIRGNGVPQCSIHDVSGDFASAEGAPDGFDDLTCQFVDDVSTWSPDDGTATLTGALIDGTRIEGTDSICIVPKNRS
jgi:hypothetical protein